VRIVYVVESSWFATGPDEVRGSLETAAEHMTTCATNEARRCEIMMFTARGSEVLAKRVPENLNEDGNTGYWYSLEPEQEIDDDNLTLRRELVNGRVGEFIGNVSREIVPETHADQPIGCVNLVGNLAKAFEELGNKPGDRNVVIVLASGISNCQGQPFYPDRAFPPADTAAASILEDAPPRSAVLGSDDTPVCVDWSPMFGQAYLEAGHYITNEQRQVLKTAWLEILDQWGAARGNSPGEQLGSCLTMEIASS
jgi:hypothetical protein